jgi:hypothetical protein
VTDREAMLLGALDELLERPPAFRDYTGTDETTCGYCHRPLELPGRRHAEDCPWLRATLVVAALRAVGVERKC